MDERAKMEPQAREADLFGRLPAHLAKAVAAAPGLARHLDGENLRTVKDRAALAKLPVLRKADIMEAQRARPPFGGYADETQLAGRRIFLSPGPVWEPQGEGTDPWQSARALHAAGFRRGDGVLNALAYGPTPGGFIMDSGALALGCTVFPAGGSTDGTVQAIGALRPSGYVGTPDYLKVVLDRAAEAGTDASCITKALVSGGALFPAMRAEYRERGVRVMQCYATADLGVIAYETAPDGAGGMVVSEDLIVEIVRPGTGDPVDDGEVGEVVVTTFSTTYPLIRFGTGDLSAVSSDKTSDSHTNMRLKGWMGRADQRTKVKGMFVDPAQVAAVTRALELDGARLVVSRDGAADAMELLYRGGAEPDAVAATLRDVTGLRGTARPVDELPNDGKVIADERDYEA